MPLNYVADLWDLLETPLARQMGHSGSPKTFEALGQAQGYVLYCTVVQGHYHDPSLLEIKGLADRGYIYVDKVTSKINFSVKFITVTISRFERVGICRNPHSDRIYFLYPGSSKK